MTCNIAPAEQGMKTHLTKRVTVINKVGNNTYTVEGDKTQFMVSVREGATPIGPFIPLGSAHLVPVREAIQEFEKQIAAQHTL